MTDSATDEASLSQTLAQASLDDVAAKVIGETTTEASKSSPSLHNANGKPLSRSPAAFVPHPSSLPRTLTRRVTVLSTWETDVVVQVFADRIVMLVSQLEGGRIGQWFLCEGRPDATRVGASWDFAVSTLLGAPRGGDAREAEGTVYARHLCRELANLQGGASNPTLLLGLALQPAAQGRQDVFRAVIEAIVPLLRKALG